MSGSVADDVDDLIRSARRSWDDPAAVEVLDGLERRMQEPLRVAVAGMVKAGKSTLLNALLGERLAPTDAGECTRVVTWYRYGVSPSITLHPREGTARRLPVRREDGRLVIDLGGTPAEDVSYIDVRWPATGLRSGILIDTPGIASLSSGVSERTAKFLVPEDKPSTADAIVYLMRHVHSSDLKFLESFRDSVAGVSQTVNALAVLSRADEIGSGRIDSMLSARRVARRYENDGDLSSLALAVVPVAGLLAESARTLRETEYTAFRALAALDRADRERLMISTDRFVRDDEAIPILVEMRRNLIRRFGIYGVRLATAIIRDVEDSSDLADQLVAQSGLVELQEFMALQFSTRAAPLKIRAVLHALEQLAIERPGPVADRLRRGVERISTSAHTLRELALLSRARAGTLPLTPDDAIEAERIVGGDGISASARLGTSEDATPADETTRVNALLVHWRRLSESPIADRATIDTARVVIRSLEEIASRLRALVAGSSDVDASSRPPERPGERTAQQGESRERDLSQEQLT